MRWKLIIITSFLGAFVAFGAWGLMTIAGFSEFVIGFSGGWFVTPSPIAPILVSVFAAIFVYRHTAQRRKMQALVTTALILLLTLGIYLAVMRYVRARLAMVALPTESTRC